MKKQRLKEKIEADVGALVQFLLDERDSLLESLDAEEVAAVAVIDENLRFAEEEAAAADKAIADIHSHISGNTSFEVSLTGKGGSFKPQKGGAFMFCLLDLFLTSFINQNL